MRKEILKKEPTISVVMSVFNEPLNYIIEAIESILKQTYESFEFIIVVDNPNLDGNIESYLNNIQNNDKRIIIIQNAQNIGLAHSLNKGISISKGEFIARMDADDVSKKDRLKKELDYMLKTNCDMVFSIVEKIDDKGEVWDKKMFIPNNEEYIKKILPIQNIVIHPTVMMKKSTLLKLGLYRPFSSCQDYDLWLRMLTFNYKICVINEILLSFRRHPNSISSSKHFSQYLNELFIRKLYNERKKNEIDSFSEKKMNLFLEENGIKNNKISNFENNCYKQYREAIKELKRKKRLGTFMKILSSIRAKNVRASIITSLKSRKIKKRFQQGG